ncbi:esterase-like activity of phytase family protein [Duganella levis]|uniref:Uncharacterized protein n=1 Tax=Duganella levis TaxID=2692169 RepID=A0ABW9VT87_9BURK|nr:hypothetical protein [Duganella levis]
MRLYVVDLDHATGIRSDWGEGAIYQPPTRRLLLDWSTIALAKMDNLAGMGWRLRLSNSHRSPVLISDDNLSPDEVTQQLACELLPCGS